MLDSFLSSWLEIGKHKRTRPGDLMSTKTAEVYARFEGLINVACIPFRCHGKTKRLNKKTRTRTETSFPREMAY